MTRADGPNLQGHIPALDGVRGLAIALVFLLHGTQPLAPANAVDVVFKELAGVGWSGVILFFVLSGFLITNILDKAKDAAHYFKNFYARRVLRIFPLYYATLTVVVIGLAVRHPEREILDGAQAWYWLYLQNFKMAMWDGFGPWVMAVTWSLAIEEQFYFVWPAVVRALNRESLRRLCMWVVAGTTALRVGLLLWGILPETIYVLTPTRLDGLAVGAWIALSYRSGRGAEMLAWGKKALLWGGALSLACFVLDGGTHWGGPFTITVGYTGLSLLFGGFIVGAIEARSGSVAARFFENGLMRHFGKYSYAAYIFNPYAVHLVHRFTPKGEALPTVLGFRFPAQAVLMILCTLLTLLMAWGSWFLLEKRFLALKRYFHDETASRVRPAPVHAE